ncbi:uncharacterized protein LOC123499118 isoform X1 [Portunus trituberculatus]|uniref:uncharacterized protein LOC123499118 isoform X1 n=1 Tax=Portunus trituberculatus TaxID=210409 RepID=UPI001E1D0423|nr:uncharacterized protein LOC123499118 isoform X1 [Portunus trituberculatus]XP_045102680.1 uncharacterized protein LOC123499118 isoform X1 [Portunus trituberculatus]
MPLQRLRAAVLCSLCFLTLVGTSVGVPEEGAHAAPTPPRDALDTHNDQGSEESWLAPAGDDNDHQNHHLAKRFIWTLTQEPYFYGKYGGSEASEVGRVGGQLGSGRGEGGAPINPEMLPQALPLRNPSSSSLHKRLYPRWYQAYVYKSPSFNRVASPVGEHKRFQPFHPLARFRGLALGGASSSASSGYRGYDLPLADHPGHRLPTAPNAQPSLKYDSALEDTEEEEEDEKPMRVGELLHLLKEIAGDRGLSGHTKSFRFGISRRK